MRDGFSLFGKGRGDEGRSALARALQDDNEAATLVTITARISGVNRHNTGAGTRGGKGPASRPQILKIDG
jgi:hypothetical protein